MVRHMSNSLSMAKIKTKPASGIPAWVRTITSITIPALGTAAVPIEASGNKGGKQTKLQASTGHKVLANYFSEGRVINTYKKHDINASLKEMEAIFHKEIKELKDKGLEPDKSLLIRRIRNKYSKELPTPQRNIHRLRKDQRKEGTKSYPSKRK